MALRAGELEFPGVFEVPLVPLDRFGAKLVWQVRPAVGPTAAPPAIELRVQSTSHVGQPLWGRQCTPVIR